MTFYWWEDARDLAVELARGTLIRHKVTWTPGGWTVDLADDAVVTPTAATRVSGSSVMSTAPSFTVETFNGHDTAQPKRAATFVALQERGPEWHALHMWYPAGLQEAIGWNGLRFKIKDQGRRFLHHSGKHYGHPDTTPERWALWIEGHLDDQPLAVIDPHLINNAWGDPIRGERRLRRRLWRKGWRIVKQLRRELQRQGYIVFIAGDLNRTLRWWHKLGENVISHGFDHILYPDDVELLESWTGDPNGSDHPPLFGRFRFKPVLP